MLDYYWINCEMQTIITVQGGLHYLIWHISRKSPHSIVSACAILHSTTGYTVDLSPVQSFASCA